jgi:hypothetical protein
VLRGRATGLMTLKGERDKCAAHVAETVEESTVSRGIEDVAADTHPPATEYCQLFARRKLFVDAGVDGPASG